MYGLHTLFTVLDPGRFVGSLPATRSETLALYTIRYECCVGRHFLGIDELLEARTATHVATYP